MISHVLRLSLAPDSDESPLESLDDEGNEELKSLPFQSYPVWIRILAFQKLRRVGPQVVYFPSSREHGRHPGSQTFGATFRMGGTRRNQGSLGFAGPRSDVQEFFLIFFFTDLGTREGRGSPHGCAQLQRLMEVIRQLTPSTLDSTTYNYIAGGNSAFPMTFFYRVYGILITS